MRSIKPPDFDIGDVIACIELDLKYANQRTLFAGLKEHFQAQGRVYDKNRHGPTFNQITPRSLPVGTHIKDVKACYEKFFNKLPTSKGYRARLLKNGGACPFCMHREANTLDHYLPQSHFPFLCIEPLNLVPCCFECNKKKLRYKPTEESDQIYHAYIDKLSGVRWLKSELLIRESSVIFSYDVDQSAFQNELLINRCKKTFQVLKLGSLFSTWASSEFVDYIGDLREVYTTGQEQAVKKRLEQKLRSVSRSKDQNHWRVVMLRAACTSSTLHKSVCTLK